MKSICFFLLALLTGLNGLAQCSGQHAISVNITPDWSPYETRWSLRNGLSGSLIDSGTVSKDICVDTGTCLTFTIYDTYGDGICCNNGPGKYLITIDGDSVTSGGVFSYYETTSFNCPQGFSCSEPLTAYSGDTFNCLPENWFLFIPDSTGIYEISTCDAGNTCNTKLFIYDRCAGITPGEGVAGTTFYNDDNCDDSQAAITGAFGAGHPYYIRVGDYNNQCAGNTIMWYIKYNGPIMGCVDSLSCNYNPLATISDGSCLSAPNLACPGPDLIVVQSDLENNMYIDYKTAGANNCYISEGCLSGYGQRTLLRFATHIRNIGDADYYIGIPDSSNHAFEMDACHNHWHYVGYAHYLLYNEDGAQVGMGYKTGFCVEDLVCDSFGMAKYSCGNMGISAGCGDVYNAATDCQWIDITDIDTGDYILAVGVNWPYRPDALGRHEKNYGNNWSQVCFNLYYDQNGYKLFTVINNCAPRTDCAGDTFGNKQTDCENVCNGSAVYGDISTDFIQDSLDIENYLAQIAGGSIMYTPCSDLTGDNTINVADVVRLNACVQCKNGRHNHAYAANDSSPLHCVFPLNVTNPFDTVGFTITNVNWLLKYIDISIYNPSVNILACQLQLNGILADSIVALVPDSVRLDLRISAGGQVICIALDEKEFARQQTPVNCMRIYFAAITDAAVCIKDVVAVVNEKYEQVGRTGSSGCQTALIDDVDYYNAPIPEINFVPNPAKQKVSIHSAHSLYNARLQLMDIQGQIVLSLVNGTMANKWDIDLTETPPGLYLAGVSTISGYINKRLVIMY